MNHITAEFSKSYLANLYHQLENLTPGNFIDLNAIADARQREKYIAAVKVYIDDNHPQVEFNNNYSKVRRLQCQFL